MLSINGTNILSNSVRGGLDTGLLSLNRTGLLFLSRIRLLSLSRTGLLPNSVRGGLDTGLLSLNRTRLLSLSRTRLLPLNRTGLLPNSVKGGLDTGLLNWSSWNETRRGRLDEARRGFFLIFELLYTVGLAR